MDYHQILPDIFLGSHPQSRDDLSHLRRECAITAVLNLQTDEDICQLKLDWKLLLTCCGEFGLKLWRFPISDFDPVDLAEKLDEGVRLLDQVLSDRHTVYLHCTAGVGRSPTLVTAYLHWCRGWELEKAAAYVKRCRPCSPNLDAIRVAAARAIQSARKANGRADC